ncbi:MAG TPA: hypothetical protein VEW91_05700, partial [bacterium]|nr:hypothetical protein [bacterium]
IHLERVSLVAGDSVEAAQEVASVENGKGAATAWLEPMRGEVPDAADESNGESWPAPRGLLGRLRSWWGGTRGRESARAGGR